MVMGARIFLAALAVVVVGCAAPNESLSITPSSRATFSGTRTEYAQAMVPCLQKKGIAARFNVDDGGVPGVAMQSSGHAQNQQNLAVYDECAAELPAQPDATTDADFKVMYQHLVDQTSCVQQAGYDTPQVPSWQSFLEDAHAKNIDWDPTILVPVASRDSVRKSCIDQDRWW